jgi:hypothetical protein
LLFAFFHSANLFSQGYISYYNKTNEAEWHFDNSRYNESKSTLLEAFDLVKTPHLKDILLYAHIICLEGKSDKAFKIVLKHVKANRLSGYNLSKYLTQCRTNLSLSAKQCMRIDSYPNDTATDDYRSKKRMLSQIDSMFLWDQKIRTEAYGSSAQDSVLWNTESGSRYVNLRKKWREIDSSNAAQMIHWINHGELINNELLVGSTNFTHLILHMHDSIFVVKEKLIQMIDLGNLEPWDYARVMDRWYNYNSQCLPYFAYTIAAKNLSCVSYDTIVENRKKIGLSVHYSRASVFYYIQLNKMMKYPLKEYYDKEIFKTK